MRPPKTAPAMPGAATRYKVRHGDTVQTVADNFSLPPVMVRRWNHLRGRQSAGTPHRLRSSAGQPQIPCRTISRKRPKSKPKRGLHPVTHKPVQHHKVQAGETLISIATTHHTTVAAIKRDNGNLAMLRPGMILVIRAGQ